MIQYVYKPKRRKNGKLVAQRNYRGRYRLHGDYEINEVPLNTADKQVASARLAEIVKEAEQERAGLIAPKAQREAKAKPTIDHLNDFLKDLETMGRTPLYRKNTEFRIRRLVQECEWTRLDKFNSDTFTTWRSDQEGMAPKTLNEYLAAAMSFLNWLVRQNRLHGNPLERVVKVDIRGRQMKRRAISPEELQRLLPVADKHRVVYLTALYTGLRLGELQQLKWADIHLDVHRPFIQSRASTTKNRKEAIIPLHPALAEEIKSFREKGPKDGSVFGLSHHISRSFKRDLLKAKIDPVDSLGRKLDFHALRHTFATRLAQQGVPQRLTQELMRHSDANLSANVYTDVSQLPTFDAVASLRWEGRPTVADPQIAPQKTGSHRHLAALEGTNQAEKRDMQVVENQPSRHVTARQGAKRKVVVGTGFEPVKA